MWNVVLLFLGLMKAVSYVAGSGATADEKSGTLALRTVLRPVAPVVAVETRLRVCYY